MLTGKRHIEGSRAVKNLTEYRMPGAMLWETDATRDQGQRGDRGELIRGIAGQTDASNRQGNQWDRAMSHPDTVRGMLCS
jgi:hypothetical protein